MIQLTTGSFCTRKFILCLASLVLITGVSILSIIWKEVGAILPTFIGGVMGVFTAYLGGNLANAHIQGKTEVAALAAKLSSEKKTDPVKAPDKSAEIKEAEDNP